MHLGVFVLGTGNHSAGWRYEGAATSHMELPVMQEIARIAERGKFDLLFISNSAVMDPGDHPSFLCRFEPTTLITALAMCTTPCRARRHGLDQLQRAVQRRPHLRLDRPYQRRPRRLERRDDLEPEGALNYGMDDQLDHELRYERAEEFVDVVKGLWDCWEDGAIVADKATGQYIDAGKVRPLDHKGRFFKVKGPVNMARCPQGQPVIIQAGGSPSGLELAARTADVVFSVVQELEPRQEGLCRPERPHGEIRPPPGHARRYCRA